MLDRLKRTWFILILFIIGIYVPPLFGMGKDLAFGISAFGLSTVLGIIYGAWRGFEISLPLFATIIAVPAVFIFYEFQWMYLAYMAAFSLFGNWLGMLLHYARWEKENNDVNYINKKGLSKVALKKYRMDFLQDEQASKHD